MDNSVIAQLKRHRSLYLVATFLPVTATALFFFLPYYFVNALHFSLLQAGLLMSFYGTGIFIAIVFMPYLSTQHSLRKMILFSLSANCLATANFLYVETFLPLSLNMILLGFAGFCLKNNYPHLLLQHFENEARMQTKMLQYAYTASNIGLGLAMLIIALFALNNFTALFISAIILNALPLFLGQTWGAASTPILEQAREPTPIFSDIFSLTLLFLGGLLLSQLTATYGIYLSLKFPRVGLTAMAVFMLVNIGLVSWLQKPLLNVFHRGSKSFYGSCGIVLMGAGYYISTLAHLFSLVVFSAMIFSLGEVFFIGSLHHLCRRFFQGTLTLSLIVGASLGATIYQFFGADVLWQSCVYLGGLCLVLVAAKTVIANIFINALKQSVRRA